MYLNCSEIITYGKTHVKLKSVLNVIGKLLKTVLKIRNSPFIRTSIAKLAEC